jgi:hypothetical protein
MAPAFTMAVDVWINNLHIYFSFCTSKLTHFAHLFSLSAKEEKSHGPCFHHGRGYCAALNEQRRRWAGC